MSAAQLAVIGVRFQPVPLPPPVPMDRLINRFWTALAEELAAYEPWTWVDVAGVPPRVLASPGAASALVSACYFRGFRVALRPTDDGFRVLRGANRAEVIQ